MRGWPQCSPPSVGMTRGHRRRPARRPGRRRWREVGVFGVRCRCSMASTVNDSAGCGRFLVLSSHRVQVVTDLVRDIRCRIGAGKRGRADRAKSGRSRQGQQTAHAPRPRPCRWPSRCPGRTCMTARRSTADSRHPCGPFPTRTTPEEASEDLRGYGVPIRRAPPPAPQPEPRRTDRPPRHRVG